MSGLDWFLVLAFGGSMLFAGRKWGFAKGHRLGYGLSLAQLDAARKLCQAERLEKAAASARASDLKREKDSLVERLVDRDRTLLRIHDLTDGRDDDGLPMQPDG